MMWHILALATVMTSFCVADNIQREYYADVTLHCDETTQQFTKFNPVNKYWMLPGGTLIDVTYKDDRRSIDTTHFNLTIERTDDDDFGRYYCFIVWNDSTINVIEHGLNLDGPDFGDLIAKYRHNAMVGGITAAILFAILSGSCLLWNYYLRRKRVIQTSPLNVGNVDKLGDTIDHITSGTEVSEKQGYDNTVIELDQVGDGVKEVANDVPNPDDGPSQFVSTVTEKL